MIAKKRGLDPKLSSMAAMLHVKERKSFSSNETTKIKPPEYETATPLRSDGLEKINYMLLGSVSCRYTAKNRAKDQGIVHLVYPRFTRAVAPRFRQDNMHPNEAYTILRENEDRDSLIINDVIKCIEEGRTPVILSKYVDHSRRLYDKLRNCADEFSRKGRQCG